jgi:thiol-disulfide isomerase/thioredoxin
MILRTSQPLARAFLFRLPIAQRRFFGAPSNQNRIFNNIRTPDELHNLTLVSAADNRPLITFWSASWCSTCQTVKPIVKGLIEDEKVGEEEGGLGFAEVELDCTLIGDLGVKFMVSCSLYVVLKILRV